MSPGGGHEWWWTTCQSRGVFPKTTENGQNRKRREKSEARIFRNGAVVVDWVTRAKRKRKHPQPWDPL